MANGSEQNSNLALLCDLDLFQINIFTYKNIKSNGCYTLMTFHQANSIFHHYCYSRSPGLLHAKYQLDVTNQLGTNEANSTELGLQVFAKP